MEPARKGREHEDRADIIALNATGRNGARPERAGARLARFEPFDLGQQGNVRAVRSAGPAWLPLMELSRCQSQPDLHASAPRGLSHHRSARIQTMTASDDGSFSWWPRKRKRVESPAWPRSTTITLSSDAFMRASRSPRMRIAS